MGIVGIVGDRGELRAQGDLPTAVHQRIDTADADTLLRWSERVLTAQSLEEVLADTQAVN